MTDLEATIDAYLAAWIEQNDARRAMLVKQIWTDDGQLVDPPLAAAGHDGISDMAAAMQSQFPGHSFRRTSVVDAHHDQFRFSWALVDPHGVAAVTGIDVGELADDGRLHRITGFFGDLAAAQ